MKPAVVASAVADIEEAWSQGIARQHMPVIAQSEFCIPTTTITVAVRLLYHATA